MSDQKCISGFSGYEVTKDGRVFSLPSQIVRANGRPKTIHGGQKSPCGNSKGYLIVSLTRDDGKPVTMRVHRLVAMAFIPNPDSKPSVNHIDNDPTNNKVRRRPSVAKLTDSEVIALRADRQQTRAPHAQLAGKYGVSPSAIGRALKGQTYSNVTAKP